MRLCHTQESNFLAGIVLELITLILGKNLSFICDNQLEIADS